jgi:methylmalonyl-CoA mutase
MRSACPTSLRGALRATRSSFCWRNPTSQKSPIPAAGSGGIEDLTAKLCAAAWAQFQEIERAGGTAAALEQGLIQKQVAEVRAARVQALKDGTDALTGTTIFPNPDETPVKVLDVARVELPETQKTLSFEALMPNPAGGSV